jgi:hypothetical protein
MMFERKTLIVIGCLLALIALYCYSPVIEALTSNTYNSCDNVNTSSDPTCSNCISACINRVGCNVCYWNQNAQVASKCSSFNDPGYSKLCPNK